ncbi:LysR family transcriptional regulator ArgP [Pseudomonas sp. N040]|uniref:LysR family transcriptional regulator ArgP n=1 Tax=Pseudomonas sp. N040 TaxID=2785325 RepID=UPI0018A29A1D|nr:LysR family transcriptional regulator ArgP [Pseudomonas sp. N040]MBF7730414.1 LysR family transcriptional regulator ArgP [Pseudomonas sp. N040]MBW7014057.1 LysR family transcriptional regulator ArgP [Pseudomonas sp. N040]
MFDYKLLSALAAVVEQAGFERAAQALGLSQSAVSQRIKLLEARLGQPVLLRGTPPQPTEAGRHLLNHVQQVRLLERNLQGQVPGVAEEGMPERLRIALNADSLATWWAPAVSQFCASQRVLLELVMEDQAVGLKRMRAGDVAGCVCDSGVPVSGARCEPLGAMRYLALASPRFIASHFPDGLQPARLPQVPAIVFGADDRLQHRYLAALGLAGGFIHHLCPSSEGFVQLASAGLGWGLMPALQVREQLARGELLELLPGRHVDVPLYWHHWRQGGALLDTLTRHLRQATADRLIPLAAAD